MQNLYPFIIAFTLVFVSELGDKTQILTLSFASKLKTHTILIGVALGSLLSHGIAIVFGSFLGNIENLSWYYRMFIAYFLLVFQIYYLFLYFILTFVLKILFLGFVLINLLHFLVYEEQIQRLI